MTEPSLRAARALKASRKTIALTGAGVSVESGIPSFRGTDGIWIKYPPEEFATIEAYLNSPTRVWAFWVELAQTVACCKPNAAHFALADLEREGLLHAIITQNIDNLHQDAGSRNVVEYHGNARGLRCVSCGRQEPLNLESPGKIPPFCPCGQLMKPDVVMFGEIIPPAALVEAERLASSCQVMLVIGTSAQVYPAATLPHLAKRAGATIIELNTEPTTLTYGATDIFLEGPAGISLPTLAQTLRSLPEATADFQ